MQGYCILEYMADLSEVHPQEVQHEHIGQEKRI